MPETHAHRLAKDLLARWLRESAEEAGWDNYADLAGFSWRVNRKGPAWGIWTEYPVLSDGTGITQVWDEIDPRWRRAPPTHDDIVAMGWRPMCVLDIAIQHKGLITVAVEVCHKHPCGNRKLGFLRPHLSVLEVPTHWVLGQVDKPKCIPEEFWLS